MQNSNQYSLPFIVNNCSLASIATGEQASSVVELRDKIAKVDPSCLYYHFWGGRMNQRFVHSEHHNDFASWAHHRLHDHILSEKLNIIDPTEFDSLEALRQEVIDTIERRLDEYEIILWTKREDRFYFRSSSIIVFESSLTIDRPENLPKIIPILSPGSIFYHFIDARSRTPDKIDDFSSWLKNYGSQYSDLVQKIQAIDPYFLSLTQLRDELEQVIKQNFYKSSSL